MVAPNSTTLIVEWNPVSGGLQNGIIRGYKLIYKKPGESEEHIVRVTPGTAVRCSVNNLEKFTVYSFRVLAFTIKGDGPTFDMSEMTAQDGKNWLFIFIQNCLSELPCPSNHLIYLARSEPVYLTVSFCHRRNFN